MVNDLKLRNGAFIGRTTAVSLASLLLASGAALAQGAAGDAPQTVNYTLLLLVTLVLYLPILIGLYLSYRLLRKVAGKQYAAWAGSFPHLCDTQATDNEREFRNLKHRCLFGDDEACAKLSCYMEEQKETAP